MVLKWFTKNRIWTSQKKWEYREFNTIFLAQLVSGLGLPETEKIEKNEKS